MGPIRKKWPKTASNTLYRLKTWVQSRHRENLKSNEEIEARCRFRIKVLDFGPNSKTTKEIQIGGGAKKGQKKSVPVVCSFNA